ncbi:MAG: KH domain-containing protein, partial [Candidatus Micrarchaeia archaeon]
KIPPERVGALFGEGGEAKGRLEKLTETKIEVNKEGEVSIEGDSAKAYFLKDVVHAIGRGFSAKDAERLLNENYMLEIIDLREIVKGENNLARVKGRVIGEEGKMKLEIEAAAECKISVYGWTISIIANMDTMQYAKKAVNKIIDGAQLSTVFNDLARYKKEILANKLMGK